MKSKKNDGKKVDVKLFLSLEVLNPLEQNKIRGGFASEMEELEDGTVRRVVRRRRRVVRRRVRRTTISTL